MTAHQECSPVRLSSQPAAVDIAVGRQVIYTLYVRKALPLSPGVMVIHPLHSTNVMRSATMQALPIRFDGRLKYSALQAALGLLGCFMVSQAGTDGTMTCIERAPRTGLHGAIWSKKALTAPSTSCPRWKSPQKTLLAFLAGGALSMSSER